MKNNYLLLILVLGLCIQFAFAGLDSSPCETVSQTGTRLELIDFGIAYSEDFKFNSQDDRLDLYGGVCVKRETGDVWQLEAESIVIENASVELELRADSVSFQFDGWTLTSDSLISSTDLFKFKGVDIRKEAMHINAADLQLDLMTNQFMLNDVNAIYRNEFQIGGQTMEITEDEVVFSQAYVTTCMCEEDHLYDIKSPTIVYNVGGNTLTLSQADLSMLNSNIPLGEEYVIGNNIDLQFPTPFLDYGDDLELALKNIVLASGIRADIGAQGVDEEHDFNPYALLKLNLNETNTPGLGGHLSGTLGKSTSGPQADLNYVRHLGDDFSWDLGTRNQSWAEVEFLHEAYTGLAYRTVPLDNVLETGTLEVVSRIFAALTSQEIDSERLTAPRLGVSISNNYARGTPQQGLLRFSIVPEATYYPTENTFQYAVTVVPSISFRSNGFSLNTSYTHKFTNSASPFTTDADQASEVKTLNVSMGFQENSPEGNTFGLSASTVLDFLQNSEANQSLLRNVNLNINSTIKGFEGSQTEFKPYLSAELARVLTGVEDASLDDAYSDDFLQLGMDSFFDDWEFGLRARFNPTVKEEEEFIEVLEMGVGLPLRQGEFLLRPYIGINFANLVTDVDEFEISTYGLSAQYECCGDASAFFQMRDGNLTTGLKWPF